MKKQGNQNSYSSVVEKYTNETIKSSVNPSEIISANTIISDKVKQIFNDQPTAPAKKGQKLNWGMKNKRN